MKNRLILILSTLLLLPFLSIAINDPDSTRKEAVTTLHVLRPPDVIGNKQVFRLSSSQGHDFQFKHDSSIRIDVAPGAFTLNMEYGLGIGDKINMDLEHGKVYYVILTTRPHIVITQPFIVDVTKRTFELNNGKLAPLKP